MTRMALIGVACCALLLLARGAAAQDADTSRAGTDSVSAPGDRGPAVPPPAGDEAPGPTPAGDTLPRAVAPGSEAYFMVDTIIVVEDVKGLVWGDWYLNPDVRTQVTQAIERSGQLSGRTWLESAAPIRDLALGKPSEGVQTLSFVDKGVALNFWEPGEVDYRYAFAGPWSLSAGGMAEVGKEGARAQLVRIPLPISEPPDRASLETRQRVGRLDITYRAGTGPVGIPRGRFSIYLYYLNPKLGYRIAGVGY